MVTYILMGLAVAAVALLAGFTGGLPSPRSKQHENNGSTSESELEFRAADAEDVVTMRLPKTSRTDRIITVMACAMVVLIGTLGVVTFRLTTCGSDQPNTVGSSLADGLLRSAQAMQAQTDTSLCDAQAPCDARAAATLVAMVAISQPSSHTTHEIWPMHKPAVGARKMAATVSGYVTHSDHGTWLFPSYANGGG